MDGLPPTDGTEGMMLAPEGQPIPPQYMEHYYLPAYSDYHQFPHVHAYNPFFHKTRRKTTKSQLEILERNFRTNTKPNAETRQVLARQLNMTPRGVQIWFQNRRAKEKASLRKNAPGASNAESKSTSPTRNPAAANPHLGDNNSCINTHSSGNSNSSSYLPQINQPYDEPEHLSGPLTPGRSNQTSYPNPSSNPVVVGGLTMSVNLSDNEDAGVAAGGDIPNLVIRKDLSQEDASAATYGYGFPGSEDASELSAPLPSHHQPEHQQQHQQLLTDGTPGRRAYPQYTRNRAISFPEQYRTQVNRMSYIPAAPISARTRSEETPMDGQMRMMSYPYLYPQQQHSPQSDQREQQQHTQIQQQQQQQHHLSTYPNQMQDPYFGDETLPPYPSMPVPGGSPSQTHPSPYPFYENQTPVMDPTSARNRGRLPQPNLSITIPDRTGTNFMAGGAYTAPLYGVHQNMDSPMSDQYFTPTLPPATGMPGRHHLPNHYLGDGGSNWGTARRGSCPPEFLASFMGLRRGSCPPEFLASFMGLSLPEENADTPQTPADLGPTALPLQPIIEERMYLPAGNQGGPIIEGNDPNIPR
ncbi:hypothetical protein DFS34DRAFT_644863 [Phlyctochytrium arcticum]|nr:hypothetical protein DFS34DRAFT_644863 [Phlyctochytrium arcticum]